MKKHEKITAYLFPVLTVIFVLFFKIYIRYVKICHVPCPIYFRFRIYCITCGGTRCISALINGNPIFALRENALVFSAVILCFLYWIQCVFRTLGKGIKILPESKKFYLMLSGISIVYIVARNFIPCIAPL